MSEEAPTLLDRLIAASKGADTRALTPNASRAHTVEDALRGNFPELLVLAFALLSADAPAEDIVKLFTDALFLTHDRDEARAMLREALERPRPAERERITDWIVDIQKMFELGGERSPTQKTAKLFASETRDEESVVTRLRKAKRRKRGVIFREEKRH